MIIMVRMNTLYKFYRKSENYQENNFHLKKQLQNVDLLQDFLRSDLSAITDFF